MQVFGLAWCRISHAAPDCFVSGATTRQTSRSADLLIVHGSGDDNVHYQNTEAVVNALVAVNKPFTMMVYPNRTHCICEGENTTLHLFNMLTRYIDEHLGPRP